MMNKVRIGVIGTSDWADFMYLSSLHSHHQAELVAICGRQRERADEMAAKYNITQVFTEYKEMIMHGGLEAIVIGSPDDLHYEMTMLAIQAGLHVLCDKPLALTAKEAREMAEAAVLAGVKHMTLFTLRWSPFFRYIHDLVEEGAIGRPYHTEFRFIMGYGRIREYQWRLDQRRANGVLGDLGVHMIDMARWLVGDIARVSAHLGVYGDRPGPDGGASIPANDAALLLVEFSNGAQGMIQASAMAHLAEHFMGHQVMLYGEAGTLELGVNFGGAEAGAAIRYANKNDEQFQALPVPESYWGSANPAEPFEIFTRQAVGCRLFIDDILADHPVTPDFKDGYQAQLVIEAALEASRSGKWVNIIE